MSYILPTLFIIIIRLYWINSQPLGDRRRLLTIPFKAYGLRGLKTFKIIWFSNISTLIVPDEGYSRNVSCTLILISTFLLSWCIFIVFVIICINVFCWIYMYLTHLLYKKKVTGRYLCWWTISPRGYLPPSSQRFGTGHGLLDISTFEIYSF